MAKRYGGGARRAGAGGRTRAGALEVWKFNRQTRGVAPGTMLRVQADAPFTLHWTMDEWRHAEDARSTSSGLGIEFADLAVPAGQRAPVHFTFYWPAARRWEGRDFTVAAA